MAAKSLREAFLQAPGCIQLGERITCADMAADLDAVADHRSMITVLCGNFFRFSVYEPTRAKFSVSHREDRIMMVRQLSALLLSRNDCFEWVVDGIVDLETPHPPFDACAAIPAHEAVVSEKALSAIIAAQASVDPLLARVHDDVLIDDYLRNRGDDDGTNLRSALAAMHGTTRWMEMVDRAIRSNKDPSDTYRRVLRGMQDAREDLFSGRGVARATAIRRMQTAYDSDPMVAHRRYAWRTKMHAVMRVVAQSVVITKETAILDAIRNHCVQYEMDLLPSGMCVVDVALLNRFSFARFQTARLTDTYDRLFGSSTGQLASLCGLVKRVVSSDAQHPAVRCTMILALACHLVRCAERGWNLSLGDAEQAQVPELLQEDTKVQPAEVPPATTETEVLTATAEEAASVPEGLEESYDDLYDDLHDMEYMD